MYRKLLFFLPWLIMYRFGELDWHTEELPETGVCSWEKGMERLPPDCHQCLELAISYLGTFIFWELFSANNTASHLFLSLVFADCLYLSLQNKTKNLPKNLKKNPLTKEQTKPFLPLALCITKNLRLENKVLFSRGRCSLTSVFQKAMINS